MVFGSSVVIGNNVCKIVVDASIDACCLVVVCGTVVIEYALVVDGCVVGFVGGEIVLVWCL